MRHAAKLCQESLGGDVAHGGKHGDPGGGGSWFPLHLPGRKGVTGGAQKTRGSGDPSVLKLDGAVASEAIGTAVLGEASGVPESNGGLDT